MCGLAGTRTRLEDYNCIPYLEEDLERRAHVKGNKDTIVSDG